MMQAAEEISVELSEKAFQRIAKIAKNDAGLSIPLSKKALVQSRLSRRLRKLGLVCVDDYINTVEGGKDIPERRELISILTTNFSSFYRENHHFEHLRSEVFKQVEEKLQRNERVRIWSAGCSNGQEPYSIASDILKFLSPAKTSDILVLASDIDPSVLSKARKGVYSEADVGSVPDEHLKKHFVKHGSAFQVTDDLRRLVRFRELNLHESWPMTGEFDAIFCRNVLIYFDKAHQSALWPRFHRKLVPNGILYLGHSERIHPIESSEFISLGATIYQKAQ